jgi:predicted ribosome quality control (RQC) complex YloA/Tae2 family protein
VNNSTAGSEPSAHDRLVARNAKLRRRDRQLTDQLKLAAAQIQYLALTKARLQEALEAQTNVTHIDSRGRRR